LPFLFLSAKPSVAVWLLAGASHFKLQAES
jgi:hypothetical protein